MKSVLLSDAVRRGSRNNFNAIRIFAAVSVLFGHAYPIMGFSDPTSRFFGGIHYIGDMAVDIFFYNERIFIGEKHPIKTRFIIVYLRSYYPDLSSADRL